MKKIIMAFIVTLTIFAIYWFTLDRKVYYLALGDELAIGITADGDTALSYPQHIKQYLEENNNLEKYVNQFAKTGMRITDIIQDIQNNRLIYINDKKMMLKNALIKSDLVTISVNNRELLSKVQSSTNVSKIYEWIDELSKDYESLLLLLRDYCKEDIIVTGFYYPDVTGDKQENMRVINYINKKFETISNQYKVKFINISMFFLENTSFLKNSYPTKDGYRAISDYILSQFVEIQ